MGRTWQMCRIAMALAITAAITLTARVSFGSAIDLDQNVTMVVVNFFSYFTILSNLLTVVVLLIAAAEALRNPHRAVEPRWIAIALTCASTYMIITGIVYNLLLRQIELEGATAPAWTNEAVHSIGPAFMLFDVLLRIRQRTLPWGTVWFVLAFPIAWLSYTLVRGPLVVNPRNGESWWYPYPFLNHASISGGWWGVLAYVIGISLAMAAVGSLIVWWRQQSPHGA